MKIARQRYPFLFALCFGLAYALFARYFFNSGILPQSGLLSVVFLLIMPIALGAITAHFIPRDSGSWWRLVWAPFLVVLTFLFAALLFHLEGFICVIIIFPAFLVMATIGAHYYSAFADIVNDKRDKTLVVVAFALLPFIAAPLENQLYSSRSGLRVENMIFTG